MSESLAREVIRRSKKRRKKKKAGALPSETTTLKPHKARTILRHNLIRGKEPTKKQKGLFGAIAGRNK